jgi:hypothetical protein
MRSSALANPLPKINKNHSPDSYQIDDMLIDNKMADANMTGVYQ